MMQAFAQQPKFDLADVHVSKTPRWFAQNNGGLIRDGRYVDRDATLLNLIEWAYDVKEDDVAGGPSWLDTDIFDVIAKVPEGTTPATAKLMMQALLAERFGLVARNEKRPMPRYVLTVGKGGSKLKPAAKADDSGCQQQLVGVHARPAYCDRSRPGAEPESGLPQPDVAADCREPSPIGRRTHQHVFASRGVRFDRPRRQVGL